MSLPVAILAGGLATRLGALTAGSPKSLIEVAGRPFAEHQIELLKRRGVTRIVFCVGHFGAMIESALGDGARWGIELGYSYDGKALLGTGGALRRARALLGEEFLVLYGDSYLECQYAAVEQTFLASGRQGLMTVFRNDGRWDFSNVLLRDGVIERYDKRRRSAEMRHIDYGLGALRAEALERYSSELPLDLADVYQDLLTHGELCAFEVSERFYEIGSPEGIEELQAHLHNP